MRCHSWPGIARGSGDCALVVPSKKLPSVRLEGITRQYAARHPNGSEFCCRSFLSASER